MTAKSKKRKLRKARSRRGKVVDLRALVEDDLLFLAEEEGRSGDPIPLRPH